MSDGVGMAVSSGGEGAIVGAASDAGGAQSSVDHSSSGPVAVEGGDSVGYSLSAARQRLGLSVADVARIIKFSHRQIEALESENFSSLSGATFVRGFIRSYARLVQLDAAPLLARFDRLVPQVDVAVQCPQDTGATLPPSGEYGEHRSSILKWSLVAVLTLVSIVALYAFFAGRPGSGAQKVEMSPAMSSTAPMPSSPSPPASGASLPQSAPVMPPSTVVLGGAGVTVPAEERGQAASPITAAVPNSDIRQMIFVFEGRSWVEVRDASRSVVFAQNNEAGSRQVVNGKPPFSVVVGNAPQVQLLYEDRQIDLQPHTRVDVARFTLE